VKEEELAIEDEELDIPVMLKTEGNFNPKLVEDEDAIMNDDEKFEESFKDIDLEKSIQIFAGPRQDDREALDIKKIKDLGRGA